jgi:hypothetical protein
VLLELLRELGADRRVLLAQLHLEKSRQVGELRCRLLLQRNELGMSALELLDVGQLIEHHGLCRAVLRLLRRVAGEEKRLERRLLLEQALAKAMDVPTKRNHVVDVPLGGALLQLPRDVERHGEDPREEEDQDADR